MRRRLEVGAVARAGILGLGITACALGAARLFADIRLLAIGWSPIGSVLTLTRLTALLPVRLPVASES